MWVILLLIGSATFLLWLISSPFKWKNRNVPYLIPLPLIGNCLPMLTRGNIQFFSDLYYKFPDARFFGFHLFTKPAIFIRDPDIIYRILVTDFEHFTSHGHYRDEDRDPAAEHLVFTSGQQWKELRTFMNGFFTPAKVKVMLQYVDEAFPKIIAAMEKSIKRGQPCEMRDILLNGSTYILIQSIFGIKSDAFENKDSRTKNLVLDLFRIKFTSRILLSLVSPRFYKLLGITLFGEKIDQFVRKTITDIIDYRKKENVDRQDFLQGMMHAMETRSIAEVKFFPDNTRVPKYDLNTTISQGLTFFSAGIDTVTLAMAFTLYELAKSPEIQDKCREEILAVLKEKQKDEITLDESNSLSYLSAVIQEAQRLHAVIAFMGRKCTKRYSIPNSNFILEPGDFVMISPKTVHLDGKYFPDPLKFRPERFLGNEKDEIINGSYFPFGLGPRICIGLGLARKEMNLILAKLLHSYEFLPCSKTNIPVKYEKYAFATTPDNGMWLQVRPISGK